MLIKETLNVCEALSIMTEVWKLEESSSERGVISFLVLSEFLNNGSQFSIWGQLSLMDDRVSTWEQLLVIVVIKLGVFWSIELLRVPNNSEGLNWSKSYDFIISESFSLQICSVFTLLRDVLNIASFTFTLSILSAVGNIVKNVGSLSLFDNKEGSRGEVVRQWHLINNDVLIEFLLID